MSSNHSSIIQTFLTGLGLGFLGSVPVSPVNLSLLEVGLEAQTSKAVEFAVGMLLVEGIFIRASFGGLSLVLQSIKFRRLFDRIVLILLVVMSVYSFSKAFAPEGASNHTFSSGPDSYFLLRGLIFRLLNPGMVIFWLGVNSALITREKLSTGSRALNIYTAGCCTGISLALLPYILGGSYFSAHLRPWHTSIQIIIGLLFLGTAVWLVLKKPKPTVH